MSKCIITISREFCSGGRDIAKKLADQLGIPYYDKEIITMAAKQSGLSEEAIRQSEKRRTGSLLYSLYFMCQDLPLGDQVYLIQSKGIRELAETGPCVIVGRCGDYVLRDDPNCLRVFIHAPLAYRMNYIRAYAADERDSVLENIIAKEDRNRAGYYNYYTQNRWGDASNFHVSLDASIGEDVCVEILKAAARAFEEREGI